MQEVKSKKVNIKKEECIIFFEGNILVKCKAVGSKDFIFTGQVIPVLDRYDFASDYLEFVKNEVFLFSNLNSDLNKFIENAKEGQVIIIPDKNIYIDKKLLEKKLKSVNFLIIYDISFLEIKSFLDEKNIYCGIYFSSQDKVLDLDFIYKKISFLQKINSINLSNISSTQHMKKYKKVFSIFRKKAVIIDLGIKSEEIKEIFIRDYNVYILNMHSDIEIIKDLNPDVIILSDTFCNPRLACKSLQKLLHFCINSNIKIYGFGGGMLIIGISTGLKCNLMGFNCDNHFLFNNDNNIIENKFFSYYNLENEDNKKIQSKIVSGDKKYLYGFVYKHKGKKIIGAWNLNYIKYL